MTQLTTTLSFGGGVDSSTIAAMHLNRPLAAELLGITLDELNSKLPAFTEAVFADTGAESAATYANVARFQAAFEQAGQVLHVVAIQDVSNGQDATLTDWLIRLGIVPVMAGGSHICSSKFKGDVIRKAFGDRNYIIGIEANEGRRLVFTPPKGESTFVYPLVDLGLTRERCLELLPQLGYDNVQKSACVYCPFKSEQELREMWLSDREAWELSEQVEAAFEKMSAIKHQAWLDAGSPLTKRGTAPVGMWRLDSWADGRRLFVKKIDGRQLSVVEWAERFAAEQSTGAIEIIDITEFDDEPTPPAAPAGGRRIVHGTPITPNRLLDTMAGSSFCVSFAAPDQVERCVQLVGADEILVLDNGAFSIWRATIEGRKLPARLQFASQAEYRVAFWKWANEIQSRCLQAVAVIPDVITGTEDENLQELSHALREGLAEFPERTMSIWHLNDSVTYLATQCRLLNFIGMGSCLEYDVQTNRAGYLERMQEAYDVIASVDAVHHARPWVHLMRGLGLFKFIAWADSADSTNVARNHCRHKADGDDRAANMARRIAEPIQLAASAIPYTARTDRDDLAPAMAVQDFIANPLEC